MQFVQSPWPREGAEPLPVVLEHARASGASRDSDLAPPSWVADVRRKYTLRITDWATQAWAMTLSPHRFMLEWATGRRETLNPLRFLAVGVAINLLLERGGRWLFHLQVSDKFWIAGMKSSFGVTFSLVCFGLMMHPVLRWRSRQPLRSTIAAVLFAAAGPGVFGHILAWLASLALYLTYHHVPTYAPQGDPQAYGEVPYPVMLLSYLNYPWMVAALAGVHRVRWWWALLAIVAVPAAIAVGAIVVGLVVGLVRTRLFHG